MNRKLGLLIILFLVFVSTCDVIAEIAVGVKKGDWIEYQVTYTGTPAEGHDVTWAKMEIKDLQGKSVSVEITARYSNGTTEKITVTLNLETGQLGDDFIIPANLNSGDTFFDKNVGNITISSVEERSYVGATRTVVNAATSETTYYWDKATGVLVEGISQFSDYTMKTTADKTNMWQPQILGLDPTVFYGFLIGVSAVIVIAIALFIVRRRSFTVGHKAVLQGKNAARQYQTCI
jgi:hypothetical protein